MTPTNEPGHWVLLRAGCLAGVLALAGCGGEPGVQADDDLRVHAAATLLDDEGQPMPTDPAAWPTDPAQRAQWARHASAAQAAALQAARPGAVLEVVVRIESEGEGEGPAAPDAVVETGLALTKDVPVLVRGGDALRVAMAADRIAALGYTQVWAVAP
jgi:hypothetical protein